MQAVETIFAASTAAHLKQDAAAVADSGSIAAALDAMVAYPWHSQLHGAVETGVKAILTKGHDGLVQHVIDPVERGGCGLPQRIMDGFELAGAMQSLSDLELPFAEREKLRPGMEVGYIGHFRQMANALVASRGETLLTATPKWADFVDGPLAIVNLISNEHVGGSVPLGDGGASNNTGPVVDEVAALDTDENNDI